MENSQEQRGKSFNFSYATRALNIVPNVERVKKYDDVLPRAKADMRRHLLWALIFAAPAVLLIMTGHPYWAIIPAIVVVWHLISVFYSSNVTPQNIYENGLLVGAVVSCESPLQVTAVAEVQMSEDKPVCYGVKRFTLKELPLHTVALGEKIPCAALFRSPLGFAGVYGDFEIHPASWATDDKTVIDNAVNTIENREWAIINALAKKAAERTDADISKKVAYFNENLSPRTDIYEKPETEKQAAVANPDEDFLAKHICWAFCGKKYETLATFTQTLEQYNKSIDNPCDVNEIVLGTKETTVRYWFVNEEDEDIEEDILVSTKNESGFSAAELLYQIHNQAVENLDNEDHHFFEGLVLAEDAETGKEIYLLQLGS